MHHLRTALTWVVQCYAAIPAPAQRGRHLACLLVPAATYVLVTLGDVLVRGETRAILLTLLALGLLIGLGLLNRRGYVAAALGVVAENGLITALLIWAADPYL